MPKHRKYWFHLSTFGILLGVAVTTFGFQLAYAGKVAPNTYALNVEISFQEAEEAQEAYSAVLDEFENTPVTITFKEEVYLFSLEELGVQLNKTETIQSIPIISPTSAPWSFEGGLIGEKHIKPIFELDREAMEIALASQIINLNVSAEEPRIVWSDSLGDFEVTEEQEGWKADLEEFETLLIVHIERMDTSTIDINEEALYPLISSADLVAEKDTLVERLDQTTTLFTTAEYWYINWLDNLQLLSFEPVKTVNVNGQLIQLTMEEYDSFEPETDLKFESSIDVTINQEELIGYVAENIAPEVEILAEDVTILMADDGDITFEGIAVDGNEIQYEALIELLEISLKNGLTEVELPLEITKGQVNAPQELREMGIIELVGTGYSSYYGSPYNRQVNIAVALENYDGVIIEPGADFSFGEYLGAVDASTGYLPELVIKQEGTIPEYGGGICQDSSTLFRAVLFSGLPIVERHPHSYAVSYYAYPLGWGLDATVYPPQVDLVFNNDMEMPILMQAITTGTEVYYVFYGTKDGRSIQMDGPYISNRRGAPASQYTVTADLAPGEFKQTDSAHSGFTATWYRTVTYPVGHPVYPEGYEMVETILSPYKAMPAKYLVGEGTEGYE